MVRVEQEIAFLEKQLVSLEETIRFLTLGPINFDELESLFELRKEFISIIDIYKRALEIEEIKLDVSLKVKEVIEKERVIVKIEGFLIVRFLKYRIGL